MKCPPFEYVRAASAEEVVTVLAESDGEAKILAGGQSLVPVLAMRLARPELLVDINRVPGLDTLRATGGALEVGALVRHARLVEQHDHPLLAEAARWIGHTAIRTRGTLGGSLAHADPSAELPVVALATDADVEVLGRTGSRTVPARDLFAGVFMTSLADDEMIVNVRLPVPTRWGFAEFAQRAGDFALVSAAVAEVGGELRIALGGVASVPARSLAAEQVIASGGGADAAARAAADELDPTADLHGSADYRRAVAAEMVRRALAQATIG